MEWSDCRDGRSVRGRSNSVLVILVDVDVAVLWESGVMVWEREGRAGGLYRFLTELRTQDAQGGVRVE
mgnify:CR=1 FL=1